MVFDPAVGATGLTGPDRKTMSRMYQRAAVLVLAGAALAAGAAAAHAETKEGKGRKARSALTAAELVEQRVKSLVRRYRATDAQRARLAKFAAAQRRTLSALDGVNSAKGKDLQRKIDPLQSRVRDLKRQAAKPQEELRKLQDEMLKLEASRKTLLAAQADELEAVITEQQRVVFWSEELIRRHVRKLWDEVDNGKRERVIRAAQDAARKIVRAKPDTRREVERAAVKELIDSLVKILGPAMTHVLREEAVSKAVGAYRRAELTDEQKAKIYDLAVRFNTEQAGRQAKIAELEEQLKQLRLEASRKASDALKQAIMENVLTPEQRQRLKHKPSKDEKEGK